MALAARPPAHRPLSRPATAARSLIQRSPSTAQPPTGQVASVAPRLSSNRARPAPTRPTTPTMAPPAAAAAGPADAAAAAAGPADPLAPPASLAFLGLGIMGVPMAKRLLGAGFRVTVWNRTPGAGTDALAAAGAAVAPTAAAALAAADITFAMLADPAAARAVVAQAVEGAKGKAAGSWGYVDVSTVDAGTAVAVAEAVHASGGRFLEAPVSGSKAPAEAGQLIFLAAGDPDLYARAGPALDAMGKAKFFLGAPGTPGAGARMKLAINALMGTMAAALGEALAVAEAAGLDPATLVEVAGLGAVAAPMFSLKGPGMAAPAPRKYPPAFPLKHQAKDLRLYEALAREVGVSTPVGDAAGAAFAAAEGAGYGDADFVAVREVCGGK